MARSRSAHDPARLLPWPRLTVQLPRDAERQALRERRTFLQRDHATLIAESTRLAGSGDTQALQAHTLRLTQHHEELVAFADALDSFHRRHGPLDE